MSEPRKRRSKPVKWRVTAEVAEVLRGRYDGKVPGRAAEIAAELGWPTWAVKKAACRLGLTRPWPKDRRAWTPAEEDLLRGLVGQRTPAWIAKRLGRGETSVTLKIKRMGLSRRAARGYSARDFARVMGCDEKVVTRWIETGRLRARRYGSRHHNDRYVIDPPAILRFLVEHRWDYRLDQVDQDWFLDFVFAAIRPDAQGLLPDDEQLDLADEHAAARQAEPDVYLPTPETIRRETERIRRGHGHHGTLAGGQNRTA